MSSANRVKAPNSSWVVAKKVTPAVRTEASDLPRNEIGAAVWPSIRHPHWDLRADGKNQRVLDSGSGLRAG